MIDSYLEQKQQREAYEEQKGEIVFGLLGGFLFLLLGILNSWPVYGMFNLYEILSLILIMIGLILILLALIVPAFLRLPYKGFVFIGKKVGSAVLIVSLIVIYVILVVPVGLIMRKKRHGLGFYSWSGDFPYKKMAFEEVVTKEKLDDVSSIKTPFLKTLYNIFGTLIRNKRMLLIPTAVILILIGLILFFAASNIVFNFFIYTLF